MKKKRWKIILISLLVFTGLVIPGCGPVISRETLKDVDQMIRFEQILEDPEAYRESVVLLGGEIIDTQNATDETHIFVLQRPLEFRNKPASMDVSKGRFIISAPGFLDPVIYRPGRKITVVGSVVGKEIRPLEDIAYPYPLIAQRELYLWPSEEYPGKATSVYMSVGGALGVRVRQ